MRNVNVSTIFFLFRSDNILCPPLAIMLGRAGQTSHKSKVIVKHEEIRPSRQYFKSQSSSRVPDQGNWTENMQFYLNKIQDQQLQFATGSGWWGDSYLLMVA